MSNKVRLYFRREDTEDYRSIAWFEIKGADFYWGLSEGTLDMPSVTNPDNSTTMTITLPDGWQDMKQVHAKRSYHESGQMHIDAGGSKAASAQDVWLGKPAELTGPALLEVHLSKPPAEYKPYLGGLNKKKSNAAIIPIPEGNWQNPHYLEFHITPRGEILWPPPVLKVPEGFADLPFVVEFGPEFDRVLAIRCMPTPIREHPMPGISFLPGPGYRAPESSAPPL
ncbi:hypothetical protein R3Q06_30820 [Rhodococcus erythropolis]|uniref:hypothetical protein n=1 Tax=Rhodococcus erythropolis group TaxID=2840174 RepID=UPI001E35A63A|nr:MULTISPECIES: hypothetical protein [Rhodococcus erythropolis group]MDV6277886.1 hypothetical protein [Rhodococcus erythropolis]UGQ55281.1 hypothetical protein LRL17_30775 [Rhodococcus qingshengii]